MNSNQIYLNLPILFPILLCSNNHLILCFFLVPHLILQLYLNSSTFSRVKLLPLIPCYTVFQFNHSLLVLLFEFNPFIFCSTVMRFNHLLLYYKAYQFRLFYNVHIQPSHCCSIIFKCMSQ